MQKRGQNKVNQEELLVKLGCKKLDKVNKVSFFKGAQEFTILSPIVYYNELTNTYFFIGEPRYIDYAMQAQQLLNMINQYSKNMAHDHEHDHEHEHEHDEHKVEEGHTEHSPEDIKTVMEQGNVDEKTAIELLDKHHDAINAVLACQQNKQ